MILRNERARSLVRDTKIIVSFVPTEEFGSMLTLDEKNTTCASES